MFKILRMFLFVMLASCSRLILPVVSFDLLVKGENKVLLLGDNHNLSLNAMNKNHIDSVLKIMNFGNTQEFAKKSMFIYEFDREGLSFDELKAKYGHDLNATFESILQFNERHADSRLVDFLSFDARTPADKAIWSGYQLCQYIKHLFSHKESDLCRFLPFWRQMISMSNPGEVDLTISLKQVYNRSSLVVDRLVKMRQEGSFEYECLSECFAELTKKQEKLQSYIVGLIGDSHFGKPLADLLNLMVATTGNDQEKKMIVGEFYSQVWSLLEYYADINWIHKILENNQKNINTILVVGVDHAISIKQVLASKGYVASMEESILTPEYLSQIGSNIALKFARVASGCFAKSLALKADFLQNLINATQSFFGFDSLPGDLISQDCITQKYCGQCFMEEDLLPLVQCPHCADTAFCASSPACADNHFSECRSVKYCANCKKTNTGSEFKRCAGCRQVFYCGTSCQKAHWSKHKIGCKSFSQAAAVD